MQHPDDTMSTEDMADLSGLTERRIHYLSAAHVFGEHNARPGSGGRRRFTHQDAYIASILAVVGDLGGILCGRSGTTERGMLSTVLALEVARAVRCSNGRWLVAEAHGTVYLTDEIPTLAGALVVDLSKISAVADLAAAVA